MIWFTPDSESARCSVRNSPRQVAALASLASPSSTDSSGDSGVCLVTTTATATAIATAQQQGEEEVQRQVRFQCQPTKCLEYARDKTGAEVKVQEAAGEEEARRLPSVTFAEAECDVREFVTDKDLVSKGLFTNDVGIFGGL